MPGLEFIPHDPALPTGPHAESAQLEAVVRWYRPVLGVTDDRFVSHSGDSGGDPRFSIQMRPHQKDWWMPSRRIAPC